MRIISLKDRYEAFSDYVKHRRSLEERWKKAKDPVVCTAGYLRTPVTTFIGLWKELVTKNRLRVRQRLGLEKEE
ncbi:MAG: hypothetical protein QME47_03960 [Candidatus Thermoplasmatota archaeon]|nr:hypothetical protein [Candidatus Thermoplasmatota archaeon]